MSKIQLYWKLVQSKSFELKQEAEAWANEEKKTLTQQGQSVKKEIDLNGNTKRYTAKIFIGIRDD